MYNGRQQSLGGEYVMTTARSDRNPVETRLMTAEDLYALSEDESRGELIRGVFYPEMPTNGRHGEIEFRVARVLGNLVLPAGRGRVMTGEPGIVLERGPDTVRAPDVAYFSIERLPLDADIDKFLDLVPDIAVEVVSPSETRRAVREKAEMWTSFGVRLVWVVWPDTQSVEVYRPDEEPVTLGVDDILTGQDVLPDFSCPIREIFA